MNKLKYVPIAVLALSLFSFSLNSNFSNLKSETTSNVIKEHFDPAKEYDEGYTEGYCDGFRDGMCNPNLDCPRVPYIDNKPWFNGCNTSSDPWKCGYRAGLKHGLKDAKKYSNCK